MTGKEQREREEITAYELQQDMAKEILNLAVEKPTIEYASKKATLLKAKYDPSIGSKELIDIFEDGGWSSVPQQFDVVIWQHAESPYLPYVVGSIDKRNNGVANTVITWDERTFNKGVAKILLRLDKIYKVIKFRNPVYAMPKVQLAKEVDWREKLSDKNAGNIDYYYRWDKNIYTVPGTRTTSSSFIPSYKHINMLQKTQPAFMYTLEEDYHFLFLPMSKTLPDIVNCSNQVVDATPMLDGYSMADRSLWPHGLKRMCFPMHAVEAMDYPLFYWLRSNKHQNNRQLGYYVLKEEEFYAFIKHNGGVKSEDGSVSIGNLIYGEDVISIDRTVELLIDEVKARAEATQNWEDYE